MNEILIRRNTVLEALRGSRRTIHHLWVDKNASKQIAPILTAARKRGVPIRTTDKHTIGRKVKDSKHQGVLLEVGSYNYADVDDMLALAAERGEKPFLLLLDLLHGPQNIGSLLRTAEICGVHGVILQDRRAPEITPTVVQYSSGAAEHLLIAQVTNLVSTMARLKERDVWIVGLDMADNAYQMGSIDLDMPIGLVVGHEGQGLRRLVHEKCDLILQLPMRGNVESLNAAVAGSIALYHAWQARGFPKS